jgi:serine protease Do
MAMNLFPSFRRAAVLALATAAFLPLSSAQEAAPAANRTGIFLKSLTVDRKPMERGGAVLKSYADMLEKVQPSVVTILTGIETPRRQRIDPRLRELYRRMGMVLPPEPKISEDRWLQIGVGSGVIVSANGYILTNRHVVIPPDERNRAEYFNRLRLRVSIPGRDGHLPAQLIDFSQDPGMDVAVIKVDGAGYPSATLADSDHVRVGDIVFALGAPFGIEKTVTMGIISAKRNDSVIEEFGKQELLQTDASINPGNSGGPLIDADGRVIGINTAIYSSTGSNLGIGFAIPINKAVSAADALSRPRGWMGVATADLKAGAGRFYGFNGGVYVGPVEADTPAGKAGLEEGDVILSIDGVEMENDNHLRRTISEHPPGTKLKLVIFRESRQERAELSIILGERPNNFVEAAPAPAGTAAVEPVAPEKPAVAGDDQIAGMTLLPVSGEDHAVLKLPEGVPGLIITKVEPNSPSANSGLEKGDIILLINGAAPGTHAAAVDALLNRSRNGTASLTIRKGEVSRIVLLNLE